MKTMSERTEDGVRSLNVIVKESSQVNSSSRIYYYGGASVPFIWETCPGTPKHSESFRLPPLTPPPSYYSSSSFSGNKQSKSRTKQGRFAKNLSLSWSSSSSSSFSSSSPPSKTDVLDNRLSCLPSALRPKRFLSCSRLYVKEEEEEEEDEEIRSLSHTKTFCYIRGFSSPMGSIKRTLSSVLNHGSSRKILD